VNARACAPTPQARHYAPRRELLDGLPQMRAAQSNPFAKICSVNGEPVTGTGSADHGVSPLPIWPLKL
jgi:hypothetical protein